MTLPINSDSWETPDDLYNKLDAEFHFEFNLCASEVNHRAQYWTDNIQQFVCGMSINNFNSYYMNPPYSRRNINHCMEWMVRLAERVDVPIVTLTRFDPSASWFKTFIDGVADEVRMLAHRVKFKHAPDTYNFPCCVSVFNRRIETVPSNHHGTYYHIWSWK